MKLLTHPHFENNSNRRYEQRLHLSSNKGTSERD